LTKLDISRILRAVSIRSSTARRSTTRFVEIGGASNSCTLMARDMGGAFVLLGVRGEQPSSSFDVDHLAGAEHLGDQKSSRCRWRCGGMRPTAGLASHSL